MSPNMNMGQGAWRRRAVDRISIRVQVAPLPERRPRKIPQ
jgi:hypothetical protein